MSEKEKDKENKCKDCGHVLSNFRYVRCYLCNETFRNIVMKPQIKRTKEVKHVTFLLDCENEN